MSLVSLHRKYSFVDYQNHLCSFASLITLLVIITSILVPFLFIYKVNHDKFSSSDNLLVYEQPMVKFQYKYMMLMEHTMDNDSKLIMCSSFKYLNQFEGQDKCSKIRILEKDSNFDGITDTLEFSFQFHTAFNYGIKSVSFAIFLDARLDNQCDFRIPAGIIINKKTFDNNFNDRVIVIKGNLQPSQDQALICPFFMRTVKSHFFFDQLNENQTNLEEFELLKIQQNLERNPMHFRFDETSTVFQHLDNEKTIIKLNLKIPEVQIRYRKSFWQVLNDFWINYFAIFVIALVMGNFLLNKLFDNRWLIARRKMYLKDKEM